MIEARTGPAPGNNPIPEPMTVPRSIARQARENSSRDGSICLKVIRAVAGAGFGHAARVVLTATQRRLIARLNEAYSEAATALEQLASLDASVATAAESLRLTKLRYTGGEATVLEVVDAQSASVSAENAREDGRVRYEAARADLESLTGTM